jgi:tetratricopeptide (TPR) repeat protein
LPKSKSTQQSTATPARQDFSRKPPPLVQPPSNSHPQTQQTTPPSDLSQKNKKVVYAITGLGVLTVLVVAAILSFTFFFRSNESKATRKPEPNQVVKKKFVRPGGTIAENAKSRQPAAGMVQGGSAEYFDGLYFDEAPTRAKTVRGTKQVVYPNRPSTGQEYGEGWQAFHSYGFEHFKATTAMSSDSQQRTIEWAQNTIKSICSRYQSNKKKLYLKQADELSQLPEFKSDPFLNFLHATINRINGNSEEATRLSRKALEQFKESTYPARFPALAHLCLSNVLKESGAQRRKSVLDEEIDALLYWLEEDFRAEPFEHRYVDLLLKSLVNRASSKEFGKLDEFLGRLDEGESVPEWLRLMFKARVFQKKAWLARGTGYARSVTPQGWKDFKKFQKLASGFYQEAIKVNPNFPEAATEMINIARAGNTEESADFWFGKAIESQLDFTPAYHELLYNLYPRWNGSVPEMLKFGQECWQTERFETAVPFMLMEAYHEASREMDPRQRTKFLNDKAMMQDLLDCILSLESAGRELYIGPDLLEPTFLTTAAAILASRLGDFELAQVKFEEVGTELNQFALSRFDVLLKPEKIRSRTYVMNGRFASQAKKLESLQKTYDDMLRNRKQIDKLLTDVLADEGLDQAGKIYFGDFRNTHDLEDRYMNGDSISLDFQSYFWENRNFEQVNVIDSNTLEIDNRDGEASYYHLSRLPLVGPKTVEWEMKFLERKQHSTIFNNACGITLAKSTDLNVLVGIIPHSFRLVVSYDGLSDPIKTALNRPQDSTYRIKVNISQGYLEVFVNGHLAFVSQDPSIRPVPLLAIEQPREATDRGKVQFANLQVQQWANAPPRNDPEELQAHYERMVKRTPNNPMHHFRLGMAYHQNEKFEKAESSYRSAIDRGMDKGRLAIYLGDLCDRDRRFDEANEFYLSAVKYGMTNPAKLQDMNQGTQEAFNQYKPTCSMYSVAGARYKWNQLSHPDAKIREAFQATDDKLSSGQWESNVPWIHHKIVAQWFAQRGNFRAATNRCKGLIAGVAPAQGEKGLKKQLAAYGQEQVFTVAIDDPTYRPFYLDSGDLMFFETFEKSRARVLENTRIPQLERMR